MDATYYVVPSAPFLNGLGELTVSFEVVCKDGEEFVDRFVVGSFEHAMMIGRNWVENQTAMHAWASGNDDSDEESKRNGALVGFGG